MTIGFPPPPHPTQRGKDISGEPSPEGASLNDRNNYKQSITPPEEGVDEKKKKKLTLPPKMIGSGKQNKKQKQESPWYPSRPAQMATHGNSVEGLRH